MVAFIMPHISRKGGLFLIHQYVSIATNTFYPVHEQCIRQCFAKLFQPLLFGLPYSWLFLGFKFLWVYIFVAYYSNHLVIAVAKIQ